MIIIIYSNSDVEKYKEVDKEIIYIEYECVCPDNKNDACINESDTVNTNGIKTENKQAKAENSSDGNEIIDDNQRPESEHSPTKCQVDKQYNEWQQTDDSKSGKACRDKFVHSQQKQKKE